MATVKGQNCATSDVDHRGSSHTQSAVKFYWVEIPTVSVQHGVDFIYSILCCLAVPHSMLSQGMTVPQL